MLGIALCEKLIRCTHVARIYALVREGSGLPVDAQTRLQRQWQEKLPSSCAARLIESRKIVALIGDVALHRPFLGMSQSDMDTVKQEAHIVIHSAADISLLKSVHQLANINIHGAMRIAELAQSCVLLERYVIARIGLQSPTADVACLRYTYRLCSHNPAGLPLRRTLTFGLQRMESSEQSTKAGCCLTQNQGGT